MSAEIASSLIVKELSQLWRVSQLPEFAEYVRRVHHITVAEPPNFRCLFIGETECGDLQRGPTPSLIKDWWIVDNQGVRTVEVPRMDWEGDSKFFQTPVILFYCEGERITLSERLGQRMVCWKSGTVHITDGRATIGDLQQHDG